MYNRIENNSFQKGVCFMRNKQYEISRTKKVLLEKKRRGEKYVIWKISQSQKEEIERLGCRMEPWLFEIKTRRFNDVRALPAAILKEVHFENKKGKRTFVRHLKIREANILTSYDVHFSILKYKIYL